jgi:hypothetical protein
MCCVKKNGEKTRKWGECFAQEKVAHLTKCKKQTSFRAPAELGIAYRVCRFPQH